MRLVSFILALLFASIASAYEMIMVEAPGCYYCKQWKAEIAPIYPKTKLGENAPLRIIDKSVIGDEIETKGAVIFTPTFLLVDGEGKEIARLEGYQSEDFFWAIAEDMLEKAQTSANDRSTIKE